MEKVLFINACVRPNSRTLELAKHILENLSCEIEEVKLYEKELLPLDLEGMQIRHEAASRKDFSDSMFDLAKQFASAKTIVIAAPYWDLMFPSILKVYIENITVSGLTFAYGQNGVPKGLCNAKRLVYVTTSGGPILRDFGYEYVHALAKGFFGIEEVQRVKAEGLDIFGADVEKILAEAKKFSMRCII